MRVLGTAFCALMIGAASAASAQITLKPLATHATGMFGKGASEISAYDPESKRLFVVNGAVSGIDVIDLSDPAKPKAVATIDVKPHGGGVNSVYVKKGVLAAAIEADPKQNPGVIAFFKTDGSFIAKAPAGALPDMVGVTPDGHYAVSANEGEPNDAFDNDPEGSITIVDLSKGADKLTADSVRQVRFDGYNGKSLPEGSRIGKPGATFAQDVEPEYIAFSPDSRTAYVTLQENNAIAIVDLETATVKSLVGLGWKDYSKIALDPSDKDGGIHLGNWPVFGMYMPDTIASIGIGGKTWLVIANEGDSRDYKGFSEEERVGKLKLDPTAFPNAEELKKPEALGRLKTTKTLGDTDGDGDHDRIHAYGGRSFSVLNDRGEMVFDSGDQFERILAERDPKNFNANNEKNDSFDDRSDDKGPEPEGIAAGVVDGKPYAFIGLERMGGVMIYDLTDPVRPVFVDYVNNRDFSADAKTAQAGDIGPEGLMFISAADSPNGKPLLVTTNEVSGTTTIHEIAAKK
jgi:hypothetical protein